MESEEKLVSGTGRPGGGGKKEAVGLCGAEEPEWGRWNRRGNDGAPARGRAPFREESSMHKAGRGLAGPLLVRPLFADEETETLREGVIQNHTSNKESKQH